MDALLIRNAQIVNEGKIQSGDVLIKSGRIAKIAAEISAEGISQVIDAKGKTLLPGMIDGQVHFREPGMEYKATIATESRAAVAGGITSFMDMPNTIPNTLTSEVLEDKYRLAADRSIANYSFYLGASNDNLESIKSLDPKAACGIKVFMGASTGNMLVDNPDILDDIFKHAPTLVATHCEDTPTILENEESYRQIHGDKIPFAMHPIIRSEEACFKSSSFAVDLAKQHGTRLHVLHISTAKEVELFTNQALADKQISAEACVHFLVFSDDDYADKGALIKCNPAIKTAEDRAGIIQALMDGYIDTIATDHAPHTWKEKQADYFQAPSGLPLVQYALLSLLENYHDGIFSLPFIVNKISHAVADRFQIIERGYIREGYWADLVLVDLNKPITARHDRVLSKCHWTPFDAYTFRSSIDTTIVNGKVVYSDGKVHEVGFGQRLQFDR